jgi:translation initiation factor IF-2
MQVLEEAELDVIFEYLTQHNQIENIEEIYADTPSAESASEKKPKETKSSSPSSKASAAPAESAKTPPQQSKPRQEKPHQPRQVPQKRIVDTSGATINIEKYDERLEKLIPDRAENMKRGKEKFTKKNTSRGQSMAAGAKHRQQERDRMHRLQLEIAKKAPLKVQIPDEIGVGELASRMKKTGAEVVK